VTPTPSPTALPERRRRRPTSEGAPSEPVDGTASVHQDENPSTTLIPYHVDEAVADGERFVRPEERFLHWEDIFAAVTDAFVAKTEADRGPSWEELTEPGAYHALVTEVVTDHQQWVSPVEIEELVAYLRRYQFGYRGLQNYLERIHDLEDIYFNDYQTGFYVAANRKHRINEKLFRDEKDIEQFIKSIATEAGTQINLERPAIDAKLRDGSRFHASLPPVAQEGAQFIIRKHRDIPFTVSQFVNNGMLTEQLAVDLQRMVVAGWNFVVAGGTGSGKTSFLNTIGNDFIPEGDRLVVCEDTRELQIRTMDYKYLQAQKDTTRESSGDASEITISDLIRWGLRMRPDRIIIGEVRGNEASDALKAWNSGHDGSFCTVHADSALLALSKLEQLARGSGELDQEAIRELLATSVDVVVQISRQAKGPIARKVIEVAQVFHEFSLDYENEDLMTAVEDLKAQRRLRVVRDSIMVLPLYQLDPKTHNLVKRNEPLPMLNKELI
jgi:pilus assembly protein CpaF